MSNRRRLDPGQLRIALIVKDVANAAAFYQNVLDAELVYAYPRREADAKDEAYDAVELRLAGAVVMVMSENPNWAAAPRPDWPRSPLSAGAASVVLTLCVDDVDHAFTQALLWGAQPLSPDSAPETTAWGDRVVQILDPEGHVWRLQSASR